MRLLGIFVVISIFTIGLGAEELPLKLNKKDVEVSSGKIEKYLVLFPDPPAETILTGPTKLKFSFRKVIDKKNPLTKLPVVVTVSVDNNKVKEVTMNDREGIAVIKDATMYNASNENVFEYGLSAGEHKIQISVSRSAIKGVLVRVEKISGTKVETAAVTPAPPVASAKEEISAKEKANKDSKDFVPPPVPPLEPLITPLEVKKPVEVKSEEKKGVKVEEKRSPSTEISQKERETKAVLQERKEVKPMETGKKDKPLLVSERQFGDIVIFSVMGGVFLPLEYGNPGGYGEFNTFFNIYKGFGLGASVATYNINKNYIINDPLVGNSIAKYHLHGVPVLGFMGYKFQMKNILSKFELGMGVNMLDADLRRESAPIRTDTINSLCAGFGAELDYVIKKYGSIGVGIRYLYSNSSNIDRQGGFIKDVDTGGLAMSINYLYGF